MTRKTLIGAIGAIVAVVGASAFGVAAVAPAGTWWSSPSPVTAYKPPLLPPPIGPACAAPTGDRPAIDC